MFAGTGGRTECGRKWVEPGHDANAGHTAGPVRRRPAVATAAGPGPPQRPAECSHSRWLAPLPPRSARVGDFHRDLPGSAIWGYGGTVPGPTIEAERGQPVTVQWHNELDGALPVVVTIAPKATDTSGVPAQCVPGLSGGTPDQNAAALAGHTTAT
jgi:Multicopper oxidase